MLEDSGYYIILSTLLQETPTLGVLEGTNSPCRLVDFIPPGPLRRTRQDCNVQLWGRIGRAQSSGIPTDDLRAAMAALSPPGIVKANCKTFHCQARLNNPCGCSPCCTVINGTCAATALRFSNMSWLLLVNHWLSGLSSEVKDCSDHMPDAAYLPIC